MCCQLLVAQATTMYQIELIFSVTDPATIRQNVTNYLRSKNFDVYIDNITVVHI